MVGVGKVRRVPEVVEFYHSLMRRDSWRDTGGGGATDVMPGTANTRNMIGEIKNRSGYLLAVSAMLYFIFLDLSTKIVPLCEYITTD